MAANTGAAGAILRVVCFAGLPAPTGNGTALGLRGTCGSGFTREEAGQGGTNPHLRHGYCYTAGNIPFL